MFISAIKKQRRYYLYFTIFCLIFEVIYESFSLNVYSNYMIFAFLIPLILGFIPTFIVKELPNTYNMGVVTLTFGSIIKGVLDIYGTTNSLIVIYLIVGILFLSIGFIKLLIKKDTSTKK